MDILPALLLLLLLWAPPSCLLAARNAQVPGMCRQEAHQAAPAGGRCRPRLLLLLHPSCLLLQC